MLFLQLEQQLQTSELSAEADHEKAVAAEVEKVKQLRTLETQLGAEVTTAQGLLVSQQCISHLFFLLVILDPQSFC